MTGLVQVEIVDRIQVITINRPDMRNAVNLEVARGLAAALDQLDGNDEVVLGVLTGAGNTFCSGMDLKAFARTGERPYVGARGFAGICEAPPDKPLIAAVEGYALAGGFEVALACDLIVAADNANFGLPEVKRGLVPGSGGMVRLPRRIPHQVAVEMVLTGGMFPARRMCEHGLVNRVVEPGRALEAALDLGRVIACNGPLAVRTAKRVLSESADWRQPDMFDLQRPRIAHVFVSEDAHEGAVAFAEKRQPVWKGR